MMIMMIMLKMVLVVMMKQNNHLFEPYKFVVDVVVVVDDVSLYNIWNNNHPIHDYHKNHNHFYNVMLIYRQQFVRSFYDINHYYYHYLLNNDKYKTKQKIDRLFSNKKL